MDGGESRSKHGRISISEGDRYLCWEYLSSIAVAWRLWRGSRVLTVSLSVNRQVQTQPKFWPSPHPPSICSSCQQHLPPQPVAGAPIAPRFCLTPALRSSPLQSSLPKSAVWQKSLQTVHSVTKECLRNGPEPSPTVAAQSWI